MGLRSRVGNWRRKNRIAFCNAGYRLAPTLDGYPLPPSELVELVIGTKEVSWYQLGGLFMHQAIGTMLRHHGVPYESHASILDFGCGCGRLLRWLGALKGRSEMWGADYNPTLVSWCSEHLADLATFVVNQSDPPLPFEDSKFSLVYSYSVFTHFSRDRQDPWFREMARVLRPGGHLVVTVHGLRCARRMQFSAAQLSELEREGVVVFDEQRSGENICGAYHSEGFIRSLDRLGFEVVEFAAGGCRDASEQDLVLLRRR